MENKAKEKFIWEATDNVEKKVGECVKQLKDTLRKRRLVSLGGGILTHMEKRRDQDTKPGRY